eukprot:TRINITY_DN1706_c0_g1_i3.p2 TRINITY_DN1706_c0_g1~~TRINITY_DN1706_c0_g1_i3.p2  ORF type:complete len:630 (-),score=187.91 TRINITY_DN1706_c0_g1_i3:525-2414(-)
MDEVKKMLDSRRTQAILLSFLPWWMRIVLVPLLHRLGLVADRGLKRTTFSNIWRDLRVLWALPHKYWKIWWSVLGIPPDEPKGGFITKMMSWGSAPDSEVKLSLRVIFLEVPYLVFLDFIGLFFVIISFIPIICALYPFYTWYLTVKSTERVARDESMHKKHLDERWFFINGIMNSRYNAHKNVLRLSKLFRRPFTLVYNPTQGIIMDLVECLFSRTLQYPTFPALAAHKLIEEAIMDKSIKRVVVVGHSQGCLISAEVLEYLAKDYKQREASEYNHLHITDKHLQKLEVYLFASPAAEVLSFDGKVHIEHFANQSDLVALLGVLSPKREELEPNAADPQWVFIRNRNGHLLNEDYVRDWEQPIFPYTPLIARNTNQSRLDQLVHKRHALPSSSSAKTKSLASNVQTTSLTTPKELPSVDVALVSEQPSTETLHLSTPSQKQKEQQQEQQEQPKQQNKKQIEETSEAITNHAEEVVQQDEEKKEEKKEGEVEGEGDEALTSSDELKVQEQGTEETSEQSSNDDAATTPEEEEGTSMPLLERLEEAEATVREEGERVEEETPQTDKQEDDVEEEEKKEDVKEEKTEEEDEKKENGTEPEPESEAEVVVKENTKNAETKKRRKKKSKGSNK